MLNLLVMLLFIYPYFSCYYLFNYVNDIGGTRKGTANTYCFARVDSGPMFIKTSFLLKE